MSYKIERFGTETLPVYNPESDIGSGTINFKVIGLQSGGIFDPLGNGQATVAEQSIVRRGTLHGEDGEMLIEFQSLKALLGIRDKLYRRARASGSVEWCYARMRNVRSTRKPGDRYALDVELEFIKISPIWNGERHGNGWLLDAGEYLDTSLALDEETGDEYALYSATTNVIIANGGNAPVKNAILTITAGGSAAITGITITKSGETHWVYAGTIAAGQSLVIDCGTWSVENHGADDYANFSFGANHAIDSMLVLDAGSNALVVVKTGGNINDTLEVEFYDGWM